MIKNFNVHLNSTYFEKIFEYTGLWDAPSRCGLKIVEKEQAVVVIATELYAENPGTSVTEYAAQLATIICKENNISHERLIFIVHTQDSRSKLSFLNESFSMVRFSFDDNICKQPIWKTITREEVDALIGTKP